MADWRVGIGQAAAESGTMADDRPLQVGYPGLPETALSASDGMPHGGIVRSAKAPNSSYFTNWTKAAESITWDVEVCQAGIYAVTIFYTCPVADVGATVEFGFRGASLSGEVGPAWDPSLRMDDDRVPCETESYVKEFRPLALGSVRFEAGRGTIKLRATGVPGALVMDVSGITLTRLP